MIKSCKASVYQIRALDLMIEARSSQSSEIGLECHGVVVSDGIESGQATKVSRYCYENPNGNSGYPNPAGPFPAAHRQHEFERGPEKEHRSEGVNVMAVPFSLKEVRECAEEDSNHERSSFPISPSLLDKCDDDCERQNDRRSKRNSMAEHGPKARMVLPCVKRRQMSGTVIKISDGMVATEIREYQRTG
jgi:hypothetical protein